MGTALSKYRGLSDRCFSGFQCACAKGKGGRIFHKGSLAISWRACSKRKHRACPMRTFPPCHGTGKHRSWRHFALGVFYGTLTHTVPCSPKLHSLRPCQGSPGRGRPTHWTSPQKWLTNGECTTFLVLMASQVFFFPQPGVLGGLFFTSLKINGEFKSL